MKDRHRAIRPIEQFVEYGKGYGSRGVRNVSGRVSDSTD